MVKVVESPVLRKVGRSWIDSFELLTTLQNHLFLILALLKEVFAEVDA